MLVCLPGIGLVGSMVGELFMESASQITPILELYPNSLLYVSVTSRDGLISIPKITINKINMNEIGGLMIIRGSSQPTTQVSQYELAKKLIEIAEGFKTKLIIGVGGYAIPRVGTRRRIYLSSTDWRISMTGASLGFLPLKGTVIGAAGLVPGLASLHAMNGACILAETNGESPDLIAAKAARSSITEFLKKYFAEPF
ncbi:MAG: PAC2 family protein [Thermoproteota archaeon]